ncbi:MAG: hypothetical protein BGN92_07925 [Sphingobacteriales bacterium 41-5]|nr:MAG: hypothetical protein BGN92_07925 [Sphingobacteriales bacterium 41-5]
MRKTNVFLSTFSFVLCFIGYPLVTTIFLPGTSDIEGISQSVTIPYRAFALGLMLLVFFLNIKKPIAGGTLALKVFLFYWAALILRMIYDIYLREDVYLKDTSQHWLYVFGICLPAIFTLMRSNISIDLNRAFNWVYFGLALTLIITLFSNQSLWVASSLAVTREDANLALNTISFGHLGTTGCVLSLYFLFEKKSGSWVKIVIFLVIGLSVFCMFRAASRGPILALFVILFFWLFARGKNIFFNFLMVLVLLGLFVFFIQYILILIENIAPVLADRLRETIFEGGAGERDAGYQAAIDAFVRNPLFGEQFAIFVGDGTYAYSHNIILDSLMAMGVFGGIVMLFILGSAVWIAFKNIRIGYKYYWVSLILIQQITSNMVSGTFYQDQLLSVLLTFHFLNQSSHKWTSKEVANFKLRNIHR